MLHECIYGFGCQTVHKLPPYCEGIFNFLLSGNLFHHKLTDTEQTFMVPRGGVLMKRCTKQLEPPSDANVHFIASLFCLDVSGTRHLEM